LKQRGLNEIDQIWKVEGSIPYYVASLKSSYGVVDLALEVASSTFQAEIIPADIFLFLRNSYLDIMYRHLLIGAVWRFGSASASGGGVDWRDRPYTTATTILRLRVSITTITIRVWFWFCLAVNHEVNRWKCPLLSRYYHHW
jgi:hypothetical protein